MAGSACARAVYAGVIFCCTPCTHARESGKSGVIPQGLGEFFDFEDSRLNSFFSVFHYGFQILNKLAFRFFVFRGFDAEFYKIFADFAGEDVFGFSFNEEGPVVVGKHLFEFVHRRDERGTDPASISVAAEYAL